jgi:hypothetical protein
MKLVRFGFSLRLSESGSHLSLILVDGLYDLDDRKLPVVSFATALAGCQADGPFESRAYRLDHAITDTFVFHGETSSGDDPKFRPLPDG